MSFSRKYPLLISILVIIGVLALILMCKLCFF